MTKYELTRYKRMLNAFEFRELEHALWSLTFAERKDILHLLAFDSDLDETNLLVYTFLQTLLYQRESAEVHFFASQVMAFTLNHIEQAEAIGLFHGLKAAELTPLDADLLEYLLYFNHIPEKLLEDEKAIEIAERVISKKPESKAAQLTLSMRHY